MRSSLEGARKLQRRSYISPGPHATWHMDGYDKLKPCVSPIHAFGDGSPWRVVWLKVCKRSNELQPICMLLAFRLKPFFGLKNTVPSSALEATNCNSDFVDHEEEACSFSGPSGSKPFLS